LELVIPIILHYYLRIISGERMMKRLRGCHSDTTTPTTARICWNIFQLLLPDKDMIILTGIVREYVFVTYQQQIKQEHTPGMAK